MENRLDSLPLSGWYPGHMLKADQRMRELQQVIDLTVLLLDARIPSTSRNPKLERMFTHKPHCLVLTKTDLATPKKTRAWVEYLRAQDISVFYLDAVSGKGVEQLINGIRRIAERIARKKSSAFPKAFRIMVCGIPNVGKSTLINRLASGKKAGVGARPGITRGEQWVRLVKGIEMLDTPGVLWPKIDTKRAELKLGLVGTMAEDVLGEELIIEYLWEWGKEHPDALDLSIYGLAQWPDSPDDLLERVGLRRGLLSTGNQVNTLGAANAILKDFRKGKLGPCTLDDLPTNGEQT